MSERVLVLTGAVVPASGVARSDPAVRLCDYQTSLFLWITRGPFRRLVYLDAGGRAGDVCTPDLRSLARARGKALEHASLDLGAAAGAGGKGRAESLLLDAFAARWPDVHDFYKVTGRLFVTNCAELAEQPEPVIFDRPATGVVRTDTRFFRVDRGTYLRHLSGLAAEVDDASPQTFIENVYHRHLIHAEVRPWRQRPRFYGVTGSSNKPLT